MNQTTISPKENVTLLVVAVPKTAYDFQHGGPFIRYNSQLGYGWVTDYNKEMIGSTIIGLSSTITEEQAKELVGEAENMMGGYKNYFTPKVASYYLAKESLNSLIRYSGLTLGKDQDCLILKIN